MAAVDAPVPTRPGGGSGPGPRDRARRTLLRLLPLAPGVVLMGIFLVGPIGYALYGSLTNAALTGYRAVTPEFVGLDNYTQLFTSRQFWQSVWLTLVFVVGSAVVGQNVLGMSLALLVRNGPRRTGSVVSALVVAAWVLPEIVAAFTLYAFFATDGTLNTVIGWFGLDGPTWLISFPVLAVVLANVWRGTAFSSFSAR